MEKSNENQTSIKDNVGGIFKLTKFHKPSL